VEAVQRLQLLVTVAAVALVAAGAVVGTTLATRETPQQPQAQPGKPPVPNALPTPAAAQIHQAFADWPRGSVETMMTLGRTHPGDPVVQLYTGIALLWAGYDGDASAALERAKQVGRDTIWELKADDVLHPQYFQDAPVFTPMRPNLLLQRGSLLQQQGHQHSAERLYRRAAAAAPGDDEAQVAVAVGLFDKDNLTASFSRLGPLSKRFPRSQSVRFYLGLLLAWTGQRDAAVTEFRKAVALGPGSTLGRQASSFLAKVGARAGTGSAGTGSAGK
jgi:tetratricopeptide (TPR) repeat protein